MFDVSKIKKFDLTDLTGRTLRIETINDNTANITITMAFDTKTGDVFVLDYKSLPVEIQPVINRCSAN